MLTAHDPVMRDLASHMGQLDREERRERYIARRTAEIVADVITGPTMEFDIALADAIHLGGGKHDEADARYRQQIAQCVYTRDDVSLARIAKQYGEFLVVRLTEQAKDKATAEGHSPAEYEGDEA